MRTAQMIKEIIKELRVTRASVKYIIVMFSIVINQYITYIKMSSTHDRNKIMCV